MDTLPSTQAIVEAALPEAARAQALSRPLLSVYLTKVYRVQPGWEAEELANAQGIFTVRTTREAEAAIAGKEHSTLYLRASTGIDSARLEALLADATITRTVFIELV